MEALYHVFLVQKREDMWERIIKGLLIKKWRIIGCTLFFMTISQNAEEVLCNLFEAGVALHAGLN
jgi:hypothetical protein